MEKATNFKFVSVPMYILYFYFTFYIVLCCRVWRNKVHKAYKKSNIANRVVTRPMTSDNLIVGRDWDILKAQYLEKVKIAGWCQ